MRLGEALAVAAGSSAIYRPGWLNAEGAPVGLIGPRDPGRIMTAVVERWDGVPLFLDHALGCGLVTWDDVGADDWLVRGMPSLALVVLDGQRVARLPYPMASGCGAAVA